MTVTRFAQRLVCGVISMAAFMACHPPPEHTPDPSLADEDHTTLTQALSKASGGGNGDRDFCNTTDSICNAGEGDCDATAECVQGLVCGRNNGPQFNMPAGWDVCVPAHCQNRVQDTANGETGVDCGGDCGSCPANCTDNIQNQDETDVDCGGGQCNACLDNQACLSDDDCQSGYCDNNTCQQPLSEHLIHGGYGHLILQNETSLPAGLVLGAQILALVDLDASAAEIDYRTHGQSYIHINMAGRTIQGNGPAAKISIPANTTIANATFKNITIDSSANFRCVDCNFEETVIIEGDAKLHGGQITNATLQGSSLNADIDLELVEIKNSTVINARRLSQSIVENSVLENVRQVVNNQQVEESTIVHPYWYSNNKHSEEVKIIVTCRTRSVDNNIFETAKSGEPFLIEAEFTTPFGAACLPYEGLSIHSNTFVPNSSRPATAWVRVGPDTDNATNPHQHIAIKNNTFGCRGNKPALSGTTGARMHIVGNSFDGCADNINQFALSRTQNKFVANTQ